MKILLMQCKTLKLNPLILDELRNFKDYTTTLLHDIYFQIL